MSPPDADVSLTARIAEVELEVARLEREVHLRREAALADARREARRLAQEVASLEQAIETEQDRLPALQQQAIQVQARHELYEAMHPAPRAHFPGMHWMLGNAVAMGVVALGLVLSAPLCWASLPLGLVAYWSGAGRRDV